MSNKILAFFAGILLLMATVVVVLGAYTRLVDAGLGCPDWPTCYGHIWIPDSSEEIEQANLKFVETPVETDKTWPEQIHRIFASNLGLLILIFFALVLRKQKQQSGLPYTNSLSVLLVFLVLGTVARVAFGHAVEPLIALLLLLYFGNIWRVSRRRREKQLSALTLLSAVLAGLVILQGLFGMWTVTLKLWPQVVTGHLLGGFATLSLITLILVKLALPNFRLKLNINGLARKLIIPAFVVLLVQITLGGWTTSNYAAMACPELPTCQSHWFPKADFVQGFNIFQSVGPNYLGGKLDNQSRIAIHLSHRIGAIVVLLVVGALVFRLLKEARTMASAAGTVSSRALRSTALFAYLLGLLLIVQIALGLSNIIFTLPLTVAVLHNFFGACLLATVFISVCLRERVPA